MKLPQKDHYSLAELAERWHATMADVQYYAVHGMLDVQTWLDMPAVKLYRLKKTVDGDHVPVNVGLDSYHDYVVVDPRELRKIFRNDGKSPIAKYRPVSKADFIKPFIPTDGVPVAANDLVVSRAERDRFERTHGMELHIDRDAITPDVSLELSESFSGRNSIMWRIVRHFQERCRDKVVHETLQKESNYLATWAEENIQAQTPKPKSIRNAMRAKYRDYIAGTSKIADSVRGPRMI
jgi:hypothetical protein